MVILSIMGPLNIFISGWKMEHTAPSGSPEAVLGGMAGRLDSCVVIHRDLDRWENWEEGNLRKFITWKCKILYQGRNNLRPQYSWGIADRKTALPEEEFGILVDPLLCSCETPPGLLCLQFCEHVTFKGWILVDFGILGSCKISSTNARTEPFSWEICNTYNMLFIP